MDRVDKLLFGIAAVLLTVGLLLVDVDARGVVRRGGGPFIPAFTNVSFGTFSYFGGGSCWVATPPPTCASGDYWYNTWADNDTIYVMYDDSPSGFNATGGSSNMGMGSISGYNPATMTGTTINAMAPWGTMTQHGSDSPPPQTYKSAVMMSVHGTLYMNAIRQSSESTPFGWFSTQMLKSTDHGVTWTPQPPSTANPYAAPEFTDPKFRMPGFFQYGKDYVGQTADRADAFVYALSLDQTPAHFNSSTLRSDQMFLGRIPISAMPNLAFSDWQFYKGGPSGDGTQDSNWDVLANATPVISTPGTMQWHSFIPPVYLPGWGEYFFVVETVGGGTSTTWNIIRMEHPWGPWTQVGSVTWGTGNPQGPNNASGFYGPAPIIKSISAGKPTTLTLTTTGSYNTQAWYAMYLVPVTIN